MENVAFNSAVVQSSDKISNTRPSSNIIEDEVDQQLFKSDGTIKRDRDSKL